MDIDDNLTGTSRGFHDFRNAFGFGFEFFLFLGMRLGDFFLLLFNSLVLVHFITDRDLFTDSVNIRVLGGVRRAAELLTFELLGRIRDNLRVRSQIRLFQVGDLILRACGSIFMGAAINRAGNQTFLQAGIWMFFILWVERLRVEQVIQSCDNAVCGGTFWLWNTVCLSRRHLAGRPTTLALIWVFVTGFRCLTLAVRALHRHTGELLNVLDFFTEPQSGLLLKLSHVNRLGIRRGVGVSLTHRVFVLAAVVVHALDWFALRDFQSASSLS
ncbi:Uncharacterised protein [uncultured archaeon]|nr:Uncharacterised protein [uncultured archaeon]